MVPRAGVVGLLVIGLLVGAGLVVGAPSAVELPSDDPPETAYPTVGSDLGLVAHAGDADLRAAFEQAALEHRYANAEGADRTAVLEGHLDRLAEERDALLTREREAIAALLADGDVTRALRELVRVHAEARARQATLTDLEALLAGHADGDLSAVVGTLAGRYEVHAGPVRAVLLDVASGAATAHPRISVHDTGIVYETVAGGWYVREGTRFDRLTATGPDRVGGLAAADSIVAAAYPETTTRAVRDLGEGRYRVERTGDAGHVVAHVSGPTEAVAHVRYRHRVDRFENVRTASTTADGLEVEVRYPADGGPLSVEVERAGEGTPVDATVYVRHDTTWVELGTTGDGGRLRSIAPARPFDVRVVAPDGSIATVSVDASSG